MTDINKIQYFGYTIRIVSDDEPPNPREYDNVGTMVCWHRRYLLGDKKPDYRHMEPEQFIEWLKDPENEVVEYLPLYLYDHSGITMSVGEFGCRWDGGQVGYIFATKDSIETIFGSPPPNNKRIVEVLKEEVKSYDKYLCGDYFGYVVENKDGDNVASCYGFDDIDLALSEAKDQIDWLVKEDERLNSNNG